MEIPDGPVNGEEEFCSCCGEDDGWQDTDESVIKELDGELDEFSLRIFFKGVAVGQTERSPSGLSGIGVVMERSPGTPILQVQKKLDFYVEDSVAELLALMDGLLEAHKKGVRRVFAFTDCGVVHQQIAEAEEPEEQLLTALGQRVLEHANKFEVFVLKLVPPCKLTKSILLAQEAIGILISSPDVSESFLSETIYCPFPNCSMLLGPRGILHGNNSSSSEPGTNRVKCPECQRLICIACTTPWHSSMSCEEFQSLLTDERNAEEVMLHCMAHDNNWRQCEQCRQIIKQTEGCLLMTCWCGYEFCYTCGAEYRDGQQTCQCAYHDVQNSAYSNDDSGLWRWESFELPTSTMDAYTEQERSQLALIQRFLSGGFGLSDQNPHQSPPHCSDSVMDTIKDLHQLPLLERFVSVISDNYHDDCTQ